MGNAGTVITRERLIDEVWDTNWYGSTKTLDVHVSGLRRKLGDDAVDSHYLHTVRGVGFRFAAPDIACRMTYRRRLLAAFAYVLVLVIVALAVPLALSTDRRLDREVRAQAADGAQLVAASASGRLETDGRSRCSRGQSRPQPRRAGDHRRARGDAAGGLVPAGTRGVATATGPRSLRR